MMPLSDDASLPKRVLLITMPFAAPYFPGLPVALIRSILRRDGIACDLFYANLLFSKVINGDNFFEDSLSTAPGAELAFTPYYFDNTSLDQAARYLQEYFGPLLASKSDLSVYTTLLTHVETFLDQAMETVPWEQYDVVGFSMMFQQTVSSLSLAKRIKQLHPEIKIIFGGPSCAAPMGQELMRSFPEVDYVALSEVDATITAMVREIRAHPHGPFEIPGYVYRNAQGLIQESPPATPFHDMNSLPMPDYTPYFEQLSRLQLTHFRPYLYIETSRGCWWGEKHHCTFCSIEGLVMPYRSKSEEQVLSEITTLSAKHRMTSFMVSDNILNHRFYKTLLPTLKQLREEEGYDLSFFFELKSNVRREDVQLLRDAGIMYVQPGLESLNDHILQLMSKGSTGIRQMQALKYFAEFDIVPLWNLIYQNPGELPEDYYQQCEVLPFMHHIPPIGEQNLFKMMIQRYNLYFENPVAHGITSITVPDLCKRIFPSADIDLYFLTYWFDYEHPDHANHELLQSYEAFKQAIQQWRKCYTKDSLVQVQGPGFVQIVDRRKDPVTATAPSAPKVKVLTGWEAEVFTFCDPFRSESEIVRVFQDKVAPEAILTFLDQMVSQRLVYRSPGCQYLALPLRRNYVRKGTRWANKEAGD